MKWRSGNYGRVRYREFHSRQEAEQAAAEYAAQDSRVADTEIIDRRRYLIVRAYIPLPHNKDNWCLI